MQLKHLLVAAVAVAACVIAPTAAHADTASGTCEVGLVLPERLAITGYGTSYGARVTGELDCYGRVAWDLSQGLISTGSTIFFYRPSTSGFQTYIGPPAKVHALPAQGLYSLQQYTDPVTGVQRPFEVRESASNTMTVKYDSRVAWRRPLRSGQQVTLRASVSSISANTRITGSYAAWTGARVRFQHRNGSNWRTVAVGRADIRGEVKVQTRYLGGDWRVQSADSVTTWGRTSGAHRL